MLSSLVVRRLALEMRMHLRTEIPCFHSPSRVSAVVGFLAFPNFFAWLAAGHAPAAMIFMR
jgi:hypothetical protein